jgi:hypothetical protein
MFSSWSQGINVPSLVKLEFLSALPVITVTGLTDLLPMPILFWFIYNPTGALLCSQMAGQSDVT